MKRRQQQKVQNAWLERLIQEELDHPHRDTLAGVRRRDGGIEVFTRERGCESGHRRFKTLAEAIAHLSQWLVPPH